MIPYRRFGNYSLRNSPEDRSSQRSAYFFFSTISNLMDFYDVITNNEHFVVGQRKVSRQGIICMSVIALHRDERKNLKCGDTQ